MSGELITNPVDYIVLAGARSPGIAVVSGAKRKFDYQVNQPKFMDGARILYANRPLITFDVTLQLCDLDDLVALEAWRPIVDAVPTPRKPARALDIIHPLLTPLQIKKVLVEEVGQLTQSDLGMWSMVIRFLEWRGMPTQALSKVTESKAAPLDPVEKQILTNSQEIQRLSEQLAQ